MAPPSVAVVNLKEFGSLDGSTQRRRSQYKEFGDVYGFTRPVLPKNCVD